MGLLHRTIPRRWVVASLTATALFLMFRVSTVMALNQVSVAEGLLVQAQAAHAAGEYFRAFQISEAAVSEAPDSPDILIKASDYAFVLGMNRYEPGEFWHVEAFDAGLAYAKRAHVLAPDDVEIHRAWAEGLLFAHLYRMPVDREEVLESWTTMPIGDGADRAYRETAIRIISKPVAGGR